jgi:hypothetical protein
MRVRQIMKARRMCRRSSSNDKSRHTLLNLSLRVDSFPLQGGRRLQSGMLVHPSISLRVAFFPPGTMALAAVPRDPC